jgi:hypothetical protein
LCSPGFVQLAQNITLYQLQLNYFNDRQPILAPVECPEKLLPKPVKQSPSGISMVWFDDAGFRIFIFFH